MESAVLGKYGDIRASNAVKLGRIWTVKKLGEMALKDMEEKNVQSIKNCCNVTVSRDGFNDIMPLIEIQKKGLSYSYNGVCYCKRIWGCCLCSSLVGAVRALEIRRSIMDWCMAGNSCLMVTLTCQHDRNMKLGWIINQLQAARMKFYADGTVKRLFSKIALGRVWVLEITDGELNGWNCHTHNLYFCFGRERLDLKDEIYMKWKRCLNSFGLDCDYEHGVDLLSTMDVSKYLTKMSSEISLGQVTKIGRNKRYTPFQLLLQWKRGDDWALREYMDYIRGTYRLKVLSWQRGLRSFFGLVENEEIDHYLNNRESVFKLSVRDFMDLDEKKKGFLLSDAGLDEKIDLLCEIGIEPEIVQKCDFVEEIKENKFMKNYQLEFDFN